MTKDQRDAYVKIERARKAIRAEVKHGSKRVFSAEQFHAVCLLLHAGDYLRLGKRLAETGNHAEFFFGR